MVTMRNIQVTTGYRGRSTGEQYITPGFYIEDDPALYGQADFLIASGRATATEFTVVNPEDLAPLVDTNGNPVEVPPATSLEPSEIDGSHNQGSAEEPPIVTAEDLAAFKAEIAQGITDGIQQGGVQIQAGLGMRPSANEEPTEEATPEDDGFPAVLDADPVEESAEEKPKGNKRK